MTDLGNIYESYFDLVQRAHPPAQIPPYFSTVVAPLLHRELETEDVLELEDE